MSTTKPLGKLLRVKRKTYVLTGAPCVAILFFVHVLIVSVGQSFPSLYRQQPGSSGAEVGRSCRTGGRTVSGERQNQDQTSWKLGNAAPDNPRPFPEASRQRSGQGRSSIGPAVVTTSLPRRLPQRQQQTPLVPFEISPPPPSTRGRLSLKTAVRNTPNKSHRTTSISLMVVVEGFVQTLRRLLITKRTVTGYHIRVHLTSTAVHAHPMPLWRQRLENACRFRPRKNC